MNVIRLRPGGRVGQGSAVGQDETIGRTVFDAIGQEFEPAIRASPHRSLLACQLEPELLFARRPDAETHFALADEFGAPAAREQEGRSGHRYTRSGGFVAGIAGLRLNLCPSGMFRSNPVPLTSITQR